MLNGELCGQSTTVRDIRCAIVFTSTTQVKDGLLGDMTGITNDQVSSRVLTLIAFILTYHLDEAPPSSLEDQNQNCVLFGGLPDPRERYQPFKQNNTICHEY